MSDPLQLRILERILREAQRIGAVTQVPTGEIIDHAKWFATAVPEGAARVVDLGSGAGVPGLIVAILRPELEVVLIDRRSGRTDDLVRSVMALKLQQRVSVICADIRDLIRDSKIVRSFDAAMSRGLGPPIETLQHSKEFVTPGGVVIISEPPPHKPRDWNLNRVRALGLELPIRVGAVSVFHVKQIGFGDDGPLVS